jgi:hypothetical protein
MIGVDFLRITEKNGNAIPGYVHVNQKEIITEVSNLLKAALIVHNNQFRVFPSRNCPIISNMTVHINLCHSLTCFRSLVMDVDPMVQMCVSPAALDRHWQTDPMEFTSEILLRKLSTEVLGQNSSILWMRHVMSLTAA